MHGIIPYMFDFWAVPAVHLLLLKSSMPHFINKFQSRVTFQLSADFFAKISILRELGKLAIIRYLC